MTKPAASISAILAVVVAAGCGGGSSSSDSASTKAATPRQAFHCLQEAGLDVKSVAPNTQTVVSAMIVDAGKPGQVGLSFLNDDKRAKVYAANANRIFKGTDQKARSHVVAGTVVLGYGPEAAASQLNQVEGCVEA